MSRRVAIVFDERRVPTFVKAVAAGISQQAQAYRGWNFHLFDLSPGTIDSLSTGGIDGAIAVALLEEQAYLLDGIRRLSIPLVHAGELHLGNAYPAGDFHCVTTPNAAMGALGARHLQQLGLRHFAFVGDARDYSRQRHAGFVRALADAGFMDVPTFSDISNGPGALRDFLTALPKPTGVMACNDPAGWMVARDAFRLGIQIPDELAVLGVGDHDTWCMLSTPPLSSIHPAGEAIGRQALGMLNELMAGKPAPSRVEVSSIRVVERQSTAIVHADTPEIAAAVRFIRQRRGAGISVRDVAEFAGISRSTLERGVKKALGCNPHREILRLRMDAAREMLVNTTMPIKAIAIRCGFADDIRFSTAFRANAGMPPGAYRNRYSGHAQWLDDSTEAAPHRRGKTRTGRPERG